MTTQTAEHYTCNQCKQKGELIHVNEGYRETVIEVPKQNKKRYIKSAILYVAALSIAVIFWHKPVLSVLCGLVVCMTGFTSIGYICYLILKVEDE